MGASFHRTIIECERIFVPELLEDEVEPVAVVEAGTIVSYSSNLQDERTGWISEWTSHES